MSRDGGGLGDDLGVLSQLMASEVSVHPDGEGVPETSVCVVAAKSLTRGPRKLPQQEDSP